MRALHCQRSLQIQDRDLEVLKGLYDSRIYMLHHIAALYFCNQREYAKKRVGRLKTAGYLIERPRQPTQLGVMQLSRTGYEVLVRRGNLAGSPGRAFGRFENRMRVSPLTLVHEIAVLDCKVAIVSAINGLSGFSMAEFSTRPATYQFEARLPNGSRAIMKPDGFARIRESRDGHFNEQRFFLEVDRSTEAQEILAAKVAGYLDYYRSGNFAARMGGDRTNFRQYPFRTLMVFCSPERRDNAARRLLLHTPPILTISWLTTMNEFTRNPLGPIWLTPGQFLAKRSENIASKSSGYMFTEAPKISLNPSQVRLLADEGLLHSRACRDLDPRMGGV